MIFPGNCLDSRPRKIRFFFFRFLSAQAVCLLISPPAYAERNLVPADEFLRKIQRDGIHYFIDYSHPKTGLTLDSTQPGSPCSVAATGFSLAALAIGRDQGWISYSDAYRQILRTLKTLERRAEHKKGFFYHFLDPATGKRTWDSEASSIDTALLLAGALYAGESFRGTAAEKIAARLYRRVDWRWMLNGSDFVCMGWKPETGFLPYYWDTYSEHLILQALAIGSPTHPIPPSAWNQWSRFEETYRGKRIIYSHTGSLFTYQYAQAFIDFRDLDDRGINYFENSRKAALANREFCLEHSSRYKSYGKNSWGLTACLGPSGYKAYGSEPGLALHDGTLAPYGSVASIMFAPKTSLRALRSLYKTWGDKLYGPYGFRDGFNLDQDWWADEYLGIDQGITLLGIENHLSRGVWKRFMTLDAIRRWVALCNLGKSESENLD